VCHVMCIVSRELEPSQLVTHQFEFVRVVDQV
jgi:hypothetical protein